MTTMRTAPSSSASFTVPDRALDQLRLVVVRHDAHAAGSDLLISATLSLTAAMTCEVFS